MNIKPPIEIKKSGSRAVEVKRPANIGMANCRPTDPPKGIRNQRHQHIKVPKLVLGAVVVLATYVFVELL